MASLEGRLFLGKALIQEFNRLADNFDLNDGKDKLREIIGRAKMVVVKMQAFSQKFNEPPEMEDQIIEMNCIIKRLEILYNS